MVDGRRTIDDAIHEHARVTLLHERVDVADRRRYRRAIPTLAGLSLELTRWVMMKSNKVKAKEKPVVSTLESLQAMAASDKLDGTLMAAGIPRLASPTKVKPNRFSQLIPFERSTLDYEKYCASLAADSMEQKPHRE